MKRLISFCLIITLLFTLVSCGADPDPYSLMSEFLRAYGAEGTIYSPKISEGEAGYIPKGLIEKIYRFSGEFPEDYAIYLNSRPDAGSECGLFICQDADMLSSMEQACLERIRLLDRKCERSFVKVKGKTIFYSTMSDRELAEKLWKEIIK